MDAFYKNLASLLNTTKPLAKELVTKYNTSSLEFFLSRFAALPSASLVINNVKNDSVNTTLFVEDDSIGAGGFGTVKKNRTQNFVYKTIVDRYPADNRLQYLKLIFKEVIIQALLQSDVKYGKYICRLYKVWRVSNDVVLQLEPLEITLDKYLETANSEETERLALVKILQIIGYFKTMYGFSHNDLRLDNVMAVKKTNTIENIKLIDFGLSSINYKGIELGKPSLRRADIQYLLYSVSKYLEVKYLNIPPTDFPNLIEELLVLPIETPIQTYIDKLNPKSAKGGKSRRITRKKKN